MTISEISTKELDGLLDRMHQAKEYNLALSKEDMDLWLQIGMSLGHLTEKLSEDKITLQKLRKLLGIEKSTEKLSGLKEKAQRHKAKVSRKPDEPEVPEAEAKTEFHNHKDLLKGDICPDCQVGKLYKYEPASFIRISAFSPLVSTNHIMEQFRCSGCQKYFTADLPKEVSEDGKAGQKYGYSARALLAIHRYFAGLPFYRQQSLQKLLGVKVSSSTVFDQVELLANDVNPVFNYLKKLSADAIHYHIDDTNNRILSAGTEMIADRKSGKEKERSGVYTSGLIAKLSSGQKVILFKTNIGHAGEWIDEILSPRKQNAPPILMSDALSRNKPSVTDNYHLSLCNAHARREFYYIFNNFPDQVLEVLETYAKIWENDAYCYQHEYSEAERLSYHQDKSLPVMESIRDWCHDQIEKGVEENSGLGKAIKYFLKNYEGLTAFCRRNCQMLWK